MIPPAVLAQSMATTLVETLFNSVVVENHFCVCNERTKAGMKRSKLFVVVITEDLDVTLNWLMLLSRFDSLTVPVGRKSVSGVCKDAQLVPCGKVGAPYSTA